VRYYTIIELITDADNEDEAIDRAGEYLRGTYPCDVPLRVKTLSLSRHNYKVLGYTIAICFIAIFLSFTWLSAGRTYQKIASDKRKSIETYAVQPPLKTDTRYEAGKKFKKSWDKLYRHKVLYEPDDNIKSE
jgi:hypothetical protein